MKFLRFFVLLFFVLGCKEEKPLDKIIEKKNVEEISEPKVDYSTFIETIQKKSKQEKENEFFNYINNDIPSYWIGTPWTFSGTTKEPQKGSIACGYFVTHVLKDFGFNIKTAYLAQQPSSVMINQLCTDIKYFSTVEDLENHLFSKEKNQVYIVGLDFHTGFITRENQDTYFIHSSYINNEGVKKEKTSKSRALNASKTFMIGNLKY